MKPLVALRLFAALLPFGSFAAGESLQERIDAAPPGTRLTVPSGEHQGPLVIDKPLSLRGEAGARIVGDGQSSVIQITAPDVAIESLRIEGSGRRLEKDHAGIAVRADRAVIRDNVIERSLHGIYLKESRHSVVEGNRIRGQTTRRVPIGDPVAEGIAPDGDGYCTVTVDPNQRGNGIHLWNSSGCILRGNEISDTRDGIYFSFSHETRVIENGIRNTRYGLHYMYSDHNVFEGNRFELNAAGAAIMYSEGLLVRGNAFSSNAGYRAYGVLAQSVDDTVFLDNELSRNTVGLYLENSNGNTLRGNRIARNYVGARLSASSSDNTFTENSFPGNLHPVESDHSHARNRWAADGRGNRWPDARPLDLDGDGAGELPHRQADLLGSHRRDFPMAGLLSESPFLRLLSFIHSRARLPGVPAIEDPAPLTSAQSSDTSDSRSSGAPRQALLLPSR